MWQKLNIEDARINMSKVVPYDSQLNLLDKKQAYFHNNRLTSLRKYTTDSAVGYKCYKRKANSSHLVDGELTDYIEINKVTEGGSVVHMLNVADSYYHAEKVDITSGYTEPEFYNGIVIEDTYIGSVAEYIGYSLYKFSQDLYFKIKDVESNIIYPMYLKHTKNSIAALNYVLSDGIDINNNVIWDINANTISYTAIANLQIFLTNWNNAAKRVEIQNNIFNTDSAKKIIFNILNVETASITKSEYPIITSHIINSAGRYTYTAKNEMYFDCPFLGKTKINAEFKEYFYAPGGGEYPQGQAWANNCYYEINNNKYSFSDLETQFFIDMGSTFAYHIDVNNLTEVHDNKIQNNILSFSTKIKSLTNRMYLRIYSDAGMPDVSDYITLPDVTLYNALFSLEKESLSIVQRQNASIFLENGMVINYQNKLPVSLGHNYKIIARLDTQNSEFVKSDSKYAYIKQNGITYQVSINKMFPDKNYDEEVNIIESDFCKIVNGYKIFNTTTYWNTIYNDDPEKIICSCDDWNGRFLMGYSESNIGDPVKATSRIGHFWNANASEIPCKSISDEQNDFDCYTGSASFSWDNENYTMHKDVAAYLYYPDSSQSDESIQQYIITSDVFNKVRDEQKVFTHNADYQLVPSILFSDFLKSDVVNVIQIGSEAYELLNYAYSPATPALVYSEIAISINVDPTSQEMVIQGAYYTIGGSSDNRKILNPYDTSASTYCCDVTGLRYLGYDSEQAYFYSPATGIIYTFNGANKLNAFLEVDKRIPLESGVIGSDKVGIDVTNIPSMNIIAMAFTDGVLIICNGQSVFIEAQNVNTMEASKEYGLIKINGSYYYFGINNTITGLIDDAQEVAVDFNIKSCKIGKSRLENVTCSKHRICIYSDVLDSTNKAEISVTLTGLLGNKTFSETLTKTITQRDLIDNEYQWEFNPKNTKMQYFQTEVTMKNADMLEYWMDINEQTEENLTRR